MTSANSKVCFVISPIGDVGSDIRTRSDTVLKHVISPAVIACGYEAIRADKISEPGIITSQVIQHIVDDPLVIADLTGSNANVFYELAIRHAVRKPFIQIIEKEERLPFDVAGIRTISLNYRDLDSAASAREEIEKQIKFAESKSSDEIETPISFTLQIQSLLQSRKPLERSIADIMNLISHLGTKLESVEERVSSPEQILPASYFRLVSKEFNINTRSFRTIVNETQEFMRDLDGEEFFDEKDSKQLQMKKRMHFILHMIQRELKES